MPVEPTADVIRRQEGCTNRASHRSNPPNDHPAQAPPTALLPMAFGLGLLAATAAPSLLVLGFFVWDNHWKGTTFALNMFKCDLASLGFAAVSLASLDWDDLSVFTARNVGFLMLSSTIGILIGDLAWLEGLRILGVRKVIVMDCLKPFLAAFFGRVFLGEELSFPAYIGLGLTMGGVTMVGLEKDSAHDDDETATVADPPCSRDNVDTMMLENENTVELNVLIDENPSTLQAESDPTLHRTTSYAEQRKQGGRQSTGILLYGLVNGILNVLLHTFGALLTKKFGVGMTTWEINMIRFGFSGVTMSLLSLILVLYNQSRVAFEKQGPTESGNQASTVPSWYQLPTAMSASSWIHVSLGVVCVSFLFPALINYAMFQIPLALLLTLESIGPLYSLPLSWLLQRERPTFKACIGAVLAVSGIVILSFKGVKMG